MQTFCLFITVTVLDVKNICTKVLASDFDKIWYIWAILRRLKKAVHVKDLIYGSNVGDELDTIPNFLTVLVGEVVQSSMRKKHMLLDQQET